MSQKACEPDCKIPTISHEGECYTGPTTLLPDLLTEAKAVVREWEKDHTVESMDGLITAICNHEPAAPGERGELIKEVVEKAYAHGYAKGHLNGLDDTSRPQEAAKAYADNPPKWIKELYAPASTEGEKDNGN